MFRSISILSDHLAPQTKCQQQQEKVGCTLKYKSASLQSTTYTNNLENMPKKDREDKWERIVKRANWCTVESNMNCQKKRGLEQWHLLIVVK